MTNNKKKLAVRLYEAFFQPKPATMHKRRFQAGGISRANADWTTAVSTANADIRQDLANTRNRSRDASHNHGHIKKFLTLAESNVVGTKGILLQPNARGTDGTLNVDLNKRVLEAWKLWNHSENCTLSGQLNWIGLQKLVVRRLFCDGEFLVQMIRNADNPFGFALKVWDVAWLDETYNVTLPNGNRIIMSVEKDLNDRPVKYHFTIPTSEVTYRPQQFRQRIPVSADEIIHRFPVTEGEDQTRGIPATHAALIEENDLKSYKTGVSDVARMATHTLYNIEQDIGDGGEYTGPDDSDGDEQLPVIDTRRMSVNFLPPGHKMSMLKPEQPTQNHSAYVKTCLMDIATALDVPYFLLAGDMEAVNFSSSRVGLDDAREAWKGTQDFIAEHLCRRVFHAWLKEAWLTGALDITSREYVQLQNPTWRARGWKYIDPTKDVTAAVTRLENNLTTWTDELNEQGIDLIDLLEKRKAEIELGEKYGIDLRIVPKQIGAVPPPDAGDNPPDDNPPKKPDDGEA